MNDQTPQNLEPQQNKKSDWHWLTGKGNLKVWITVGIVFFVIILIVIFSEPDSNQQNELQQQEQTQEQASEKQSDQSGTEDKKKEAVKKKEEPFYEELEYDDRVLIENHFYLVSTGESEENLEKIAKEIKSNKCKKQCNILLYDDKKAYELDKQTYEMSTPEEVQEWEVNYYVYVADHFVGLQAFDSESLWHYPFKDSKYKELKSNQ